MAMEAILRALVEAHLRYIALGTVYWLVVHAGKEGGAGFQLVGGLYWKQARQASGTTGSRARKWKSKSNPQRSVDPPPISGTVDLE